MFVGDNIQFFYTIVFINTKDAELIAWNFLHPVPRPPIRDPDRNSLSSKTSIWYAFGLWPFGSQ